jgi:hypothetical protein
MKRNTLRKKTRMKRRRQNKKTKRMRGGNVDDQKSVDFNPNLAYDAKQMGGVKQMRGLYQMGGQNLGAGCPDPNFSIYNTNQLSLFPYRPT